MIPDAEAEIRRSIVLNSLRRGFQSDNVVGISPEEYLRRNPGCCSVEGGAASPIEWLIWDRYSLPKYQARAAYAYRDGGSIVRYEHHGRADACGRIPDEYGMGETVAGPEPRPGCTPPAALPDAPADAPGICAPSPPPRRAAVPIEEADRLYRLKVDAMAPQGRHRTR